MITASLRARAIPRGTAISQKAPGTPRAFWLMASMTEFYRAQLAGFSGAIDTIDGHLDIQDISNDSSKIEITLAWNATMITSAQLRAARALLRIDQKTLAGMAGVSVPTIQRMEASQGNVRGLIESLTRIVEALDRAGIELISEGAASSAGGRGVRLKSSAETSPATATDANNGSGNVGG